MPNLSNLDAWKSMNSSKNEVPTLTKNRTKQLFPLSMNNVEKPIHKVANRTISFPVQVVAIFVVLENLVLVS